MENKKRFVLYTVIVETDRPETLEDTLKDKYRREDVAFFRADVCDTKKDAMDMWICKEAVENAHKIERERIIEIIKKYRIKVEAGLLLEKEGRKRVELITHVCQTTKDGIIFRINKEDEQPKPSFLTRINAGVSAGR